MSVWGTLLLIIFLGWATSARADLTAAVSLESGAPTTIDPGGLTQLEISLGNSNEAAPITGVSFSNSLPGTLPDGLFLAGTPTYECTDPLTGSTSSGTGTFSAAGQSVSLTGGTIPARANGEDGLCTIVLPVSAGTSSGSFATYSYTIADGAVTGNDGLPVANTGAVSQSINVRGMSAPRVTSHSLTNGATIVLGGDSQTLTFRIDNDSDFAISNFTFENVFPLLGGSAAYEIASLPNATATCSDGSSPSFSSPPVAGDISFEVLGTLPANGFCTWSVDLSALTTDGNFAIVVFSFVGPVVSWSSDIGIPLESSSSLAVTLQSPLLVDLDFANAELSTGQTDTMTMTWTNLADSAMTITSFAHDPMDSIGAALHGLKLSGAPVMSCTGGTIAQTFTLLSVDEGYALSGPLTLQPGAVCTITVTFVGSVQSAGVPITYTSSVSDANFSIGSLGGLAVVAQSASDSILVGDGIRVRIAAVPSSVGRGQPIQYQITLENFGFSDVNNITITDSLPPGTGFLTGSINGVDFTPTLSGTGCAGLSESNILDAITAVFGLGTLPGRISVNDTSECIITFWIQAPTSGGGPVSNDVPVGAVTWDSGASSNAVASNTASTSIISMLEVFNEFNPSLAFEGTVSTLTITLSNWSVASLFNLGFSFSLPSDAGQLIVAPIPNASTTCGGTLTAAAGSSLISLSGAGVPERLSGGVGVAGTCFVQLDVVGPAGSYTNSFFATADALNGNGSAFGAVSATSNAAALTYQSALSGAMFFQPGAIQLGGRALLYIRLVNSGAGQLTGVGLTNTLPSGLTVAAGSTPYATCDGDTAIAVSPDSTTIDLTGALLPGSQSCDLVVEVQGDSGGPWPNEIPVGDISADGGVINLTPVSDTLGLLPAQDLFLAKSVTPSSLSFPGQPARLTVEITNSALPSTDLSLADFFTTDGTAGGALNGMAIAVAPDPLTTCSDGIVSATPGGTSFALSGANLAGNETCQFSVNMTSSTIGGVTNTIPVGQIQTAEGFTNANEASTSVTTGGNFGILKSFESDVIVPGETSRLTITVVNGTGLPVASLNVTDPLPAGLTVVGSGSPTTTCGGTVTAPTTGPIELTGGAIAARAGTTPANCEIGVDVTALSADSFTNTIEPGDVTGSAGGVAVSNADAASATLTASPALEVQIAIEGLTLDATIQSGAPFSTGSATSTIGTDEVLTIRIRNPGTIDLTGVAFDDLLPSGLVLSTAPNGSTTCSGGSVSASVSGTSIGLGAAFIPASASCTVTANVISNIPGVYVDDIPVGSVTSLEGVVNALATSAELIVLEPPGIGLEFALPVIAPGGTTTTIITLTNPNDAALTLTEDFVFDLPSAPGPIVVAGSPNISTSCSGAVSATPGGSSFTLASAATIPVGGCEIRVDATGTVAGSYTGVIASGDLVSNAGPNQGTATASLEISVEGYVSGRVYSDNNVVPNGIFDPGLDTPISGVAIELHETADCSGAASQSLLSDASGNYIFFPLAAGTYSICQPTQPTGSINGTPSAGPIVTVGSSTGTPGAASNPTATSSEIAGIVLGTDGTNTSGSPDNAFAEVFESSISGRVFLDTNNDGLINGTDAGIAGETVELLLGSAVIDTQVTAGDGSYSFSGLAPDTYTVRQLDQPVGTANGLTVPGSVPNGGTPGSGTAVGATPSQIVGIVLPPNTISPDNNFAEIPNSRGISGVVFLDFGDDGVLDGPDYGLPGETIDLTGVDINSNPVSDSTTTDADGRFEFIGLPEGTYTLTQPAQPDDTTDGQTTAGSTGGTATAQGTTPSVIDGIDLTGLSTSSSSNVFPEVPAPAADLAVSIGHSPDSFAADNDDGLIIVTPGNVGAVDTSGTITVVTALPAGIVPTAASGPGYACSISSQIVTCTTSDVISATSVGNAITIATQTDPGTDGQILVATTAVSGGGELASFEGNNSDSDTIPIAAGADIAGSIWRDLDHDNVRDAGEPAVAGWTVELVRAGVILDTTTTDGAGQYLLSSEQPGTGYQVRFREPTNGSVFGASVPNETGAAFIDGVVDPAANPGGADLSTGELTGLTLTAGETIAGQSLPLDPAGVAYDSISRLPVSGATLTISGPAGFSSADVVGGSTSTITGVDGFYQFLLLPGAPAGTYALSVSGYPGSYIPLPSSIIPACTSALSVGAVPDPALVQSQSTAPPSTQTLHDPTACATSSATLAAGGGSTQHYLTFAITPGTSADVLNNHIPLDPILEDSFVVTKSTPSAEVYRGALVPFTITSTNSLPATIPGVELTDVMPPGFSYRSGTATIDGLPVEPAVSGRTLTWPGQSFASGETKELRLVLVVGAGVGDGDYTNQAYAVNPLVSMIISNIATATVRIAPDPIFDCSDVIGKVFDDRNGNGIQDSGEPGLTNVTLATVNGTLITTDEFGRYHVPCAEIPDAFNGSNFIMKLDETTLPFGYLMTSENPEVVRVTRGKAAKLNFGAAIHRLAKIELFEDAFDGLEPIPELKNSIRLLPGSIEDKPTIVRLIHRGIVPEAQPRLDLLESLLRRNWGRDGCCYKLRVEQEILPAILSTKGGK